MKPILVHIHTFYAEILPSLKEKLQVLPYPHELRVTHPETNHEIEELCHGRVKLENMLPVPN